jgi:hypothetical protein
MMDHYLDNTGLEDLIKRISELAATKVNAESGKSLVTDEERDKLSTIEAGAQANVQPDWDETDSSSDSFIKNKLSEITNTELEALLV